MAMTETDPSRPLQFAPTPRLNILQAPQSTRPTESKATPLPAPTAAKFACRTKPAQTGRGPVRPFPASARTMVAHPSPRDIVLHIPQEPASSPRPKRRAPGPKPRTTVFSPPSCFLPAEHTTDYICARVCQQGYQRHQNRDIHQQRQIACQRGLPGKLSNTRQAA